MSTFTHSWWGMSALTSLVLLAPGCSEAPICDGESLSAALAGARAGDQIEVGACRVEGTFRVPAGVALVGQSASTSVLAAAAGTEPAVTLEVGASPTRLEGLRIESGAPAGVYAEGAGAVELRDVEVEAQVGLAVFFSGLDSVTLERVQLTGPVPEPSGTDFSDAVFISVAASAPDVVAMRPDAECGAAVSRQCTSDERREAACPGCGTVQQYCDECGQWVSVMATQGLTLVGVSDVSLSDVDVRGFAQFGVVARGASASSLTWLGGAVEGNLGHGLYADGVAVTLQDVRIERTYSGFRGSPGAGAYVVAAAGPASIETHGLLLNDNRGYGMIQIGGASTFEARHDGLMASANGAAALWSGDNDRFELSGATLEDNDAGGVVLVGAGAVAISDTVVRGTRQRRLSVGADELFGAVELGDGIQIFDSLNQVSLRNVTLEANERVGLSLDLGAAGADVDVCGAARDGICFDNVTVQADAGSRGAIAGNMTAEVMPHVFSVQPVGSGTWDLGIAREGAAVDDASFATGLELVGVVGPLDTPAPAVVGPLD